MPPPPKISDGAGWIGGAAAVNSILGYRVVGLQCHDNDTLGVQQRIAKLSKTSIFSCRTLKYSVGQHWYYWKLRWKTNRNSYAIALSNGNIASDHWVTKPPQIASTFWSSSIFLERLKLVFKFCTHIDDLKCDSLGVTDHSKIGVVRITWPTIWILVHQSYLWNGWNYRRLKSGHSQSAPCRQMDVTRDHADCVAIQ